TSIFTECVAAPDFTPEALAILQQKPSLRVLLAPYARAEGRLRERHMRSVHGAFLMQDTDGGSFAAERWRPVTKVLPDPATLADLRFAMTV
ncbi:hypothetical protein ACXYUI_28210, partial [Klebsiella pneumoniae]